MSSRSYSCYQQLQLKIRMKSASRTVNTYETKRKEGQTCKTCKMNVNSAFKCNVMYERSAFDATTYVQERQRSSNHNTKTAVRSETMQQNSSESHVQRIFQVLTIHHFHEQPRYENYSKFFHMKF